jgi:predicted AAA+ superfamily ATPase
MENRKERLRMVIEEYWRSELPKAKARVIKLKVESDLINDVIGPRRAGKTYLMFLTIKELLKSGVDKKATVYINFENRKLLPLTPEYFDYLIEFIYARRLLDEYEKIFVFLDEVQRVESWEKYVRSIYDEFKGKIKMFISGSTSKLTGSELSYLLTGRHLTSNVFPLSFREFMFFKDFGYGYGEEYLIEKDISVIKEMLREYIMFGGFPEVVLAQAESNKEELVQTLFVDIVSRDILPKLKRKREIAEEIAYFLASNMGKLVSFTKLSGMLNTRGIKISVPTLEKYFYIMKEAFLFFDLRIFSYKVKDQLQYPRKIYAIDTGLASFSGFKFSEDAGRLMENVVVLELTRRKTVSPIIEVYYWKDKQQREVDFVLKNGLKIEQLIQVTFASSKEEVETREKRALIKASEELKCDDMLVITWDYESEEEFKGNRIKIIPLWKWLLESS